MSTCPHSSRPDADPKTCTQCLGMAARCVQAPTTPADRAAVIFPHLSHSQARAVSDDPPNVLQGRPPAHGPRPQAATEASIADFLRCVREGRRQEGPHLPTAEERVLRCARARSGARTRQESTS